MDLCKSLIVRPGLLIGPFMGERVEDICDRYNAACDRNRFSGQSKITISIPMFMMSERNFLSHLQQREAATGEDFGAQRRVSFHMLKLFRCELARLEQNGIG